MTDTSSPAPATPATDPDRWLGALEDLFLIPEANRDCKVHEAEALEMLRCGERVLDELVAAGLPFAEAGEERRYCWFDLFNLALYSGSERSLPELAFTFALRWMAGASGSWLEPRRWRLSLTLAGDPSHSCEAAADWRVAAIEPAGHGVHLERLQTEASTGEIHPERDGHDLTFTASAPVTVTATLATRGEQRELRDPPVRAVVERFMARELRWARLPEALQHQSEYLHSSGVTNCISAGLELERELRELGCEVRTRRGWILGMLDIEHSWLEIVDADGETKFVDPIFAMFADLVPRSAPDFREACLGSALNRIVTTGHGAGEPLVGYRCCGEERHSERRVLTKRLPSEEER